MEVGPLLEGARGVGVAALNAPTSVTLAGPTPALQAVAARLAKAGVFHRFVPVTVPYHSPLMDGLGSELRAAIARLRPRAGRLPLYSTVSGRRATGAELDVDHWWQNVRAPVRLLPAVTALLEDGFRLFVEVGPHPVLAPALRETIGPSGGLSFATLRRDRPELRGLLDTLAGLHCAGHPLRWERLFPARPFVSLPRYRWQRRRHWIEAEPSRQDRLGGPHPLLGIPVDGPEPGWEGDLDGPELAYLGQHRVDGAVVLPASAYLELGVAALRQLQPEAPLALGPIRFCKPLLLAAGQGGKVRTVFDPRRASLAVHARSDRPGPGSWALHAEAAQTGAGPGALPPPGAADGAPESDGLTRAETLRRRMPVFVSGPALYADLQRRGYDYGPAFRAATAQWRGDRELLTELVFPDPVAAQSDAYHFHPAALDACLHSLLPAAPDGLYLPQEIRRLVIFRRPGDRAWVHARLQHQGEDAVVADLTVFDQHGTLATVVGLRAQRADRARGRLVEGYAQRWMPVEAGAPAPVGRSWLVFVDRAGLGQAVAEQLIAAGARCVLVKVGSRYQGGPDWTVQPDSAADFDRLWSELAAAGSAITGVLFLWALDDAEAGGAAAVERGIEVCLTATRLLQAILRQRARPRLWMATRGAERVAREDEVHPAQALLWGLARTACLEHPEFQSTVIDLDPASGPGEATALARELLCDRGEEEMARRAGQLHVHRFATLDLDGQHPTEPRDPDRGVYAWQGPRPGSGSRFRERPSRAPASGELEIRVRAAGPAGEGGPRAGWLCAGEVVTAGPDTSLPAGTPVVAVGADVAATRVTLPESCVCRRPGSLTAARAAGLSPLLIAHHALVRLGRLEAGETLVLIGLGAELGAAAGRIAARRGARLCEPTEEARADLIFCDAAAAAGGAGLSLRSGGRLVVLGNGRPRPASDGPPLPSHLDAGVFWFDPGRLLASRPEALARALAELLQTPLPEEPPAHEPAILTLDPGPLAVEVEARQLLSAEASYLVAGASSGFGLATAKWLVEQGARNLVLLSRRGADSAEAAPILRELQGRARLLPLCADVTRVADVRAALATAAGCLPPLRGVIHAVSDYTMRPGQDALLAHASPDLMRDLMRAKAVGAFTLHEETRGLPLDFFVLYSSIAALVGSVGTAPYVAANAYLDALAHHRVARGLPGLSINWGAIADVGVLARNPDLAHHNDVLGYVRLPSAALLEKLGRLLATRQAQLCVARIDWPVFARAHPSVARSARFSQLGDRLGAGSAAGERVALARSLASGPPHEREALVLEKVREILGGVTRASAPAIDPARSILDLGVDSLTAVELQVALQERIGVAVPLILLLRGPSPRELAKTLLLEAPAAAAP